MTIGVARSSRFTGMPKSARCRSARRPPRRRPARPAARRRPPRRRRAGGRLTPARLMVTGASKSDSVDVDRGRSAVGAVQAERRVHQPVAGGVDGEQRRHVTGDAGHQSGGDRLRARCRDTCQRSPSVPGDRRATAADAAPCGDAARRIQDRGRVVDVPASAAGTWAKPPVAALDVELAADQHEFHLDQLAELHDRRRTLGVTGRSEVALALVQRSGPAVRPSTVEGEVRATGHGLPSRPPSPASSSAAVGGGAVDVAAGRGRRRAARAPGERQQHPRQHTAQRAPPHHRWIVSAVRPVAARAAAPPETPTRVADQMVDAPFERGALLAPARPARQRRVPARAQPRRSTWPG